MKLVSFIIVATFFLFIAQDAKAETSKSYALQSRVMLAAFRCSIYSSENEKIELANKFLKIGHDAGLAYFQAKIDNKINKEDTNENVPVIVIFVSEGPSADFMVGRAYEAISSNAIDVVLDKGGMNDSSIKKANAQREFISNNCSAIEALKE